LEAGYDYLLDQYEFIDANRTVALGAPYGGYMVFLLGFVTDIRLIGFKVILLEGNSKH
jgi:dipeptidyl aminopeptidase/acylaminoacyl peptidase